MDDLDSEAKCFNELLARLECEAENKLRDYMVGFGDGDRAKVWTCPWIRFARSITGWNPQNVKGILILQDWGLTEGEPLELSTQVEGIDKSINSDHDPEFEDNTIRNLRSLELLKMGMTKGEWIVMNAVWGCRPTGAEKCGSLTTAIHSAAFPIWSEVVKFFAKRPLPKLKVVFAGDWARFKRMTIADNDLEKFMKRSAESYKIKSYDFPAKNHEAHFCHHPSSWSSGDNKNDGFLIQKLADLAAQVFFCKMF